MMNPTAVQIITDMKTMTPEQLRVLNKALVSEMKTRQTINSIYAAKKIAIGDVVCFRQGKRNPRIVTINVERMRDGKIFGHETTGYGEWTVPASLVTHA